MKTSTKIILGVTGGVVVVGVGIVLYAQATGPRLQTDTGDRPRSFADTAAELAGIVADSAQTYRDLTTAGGVASSGAGGGGGQYTPVDTGASGGGSQYS